MGYLRASDEFLKSGPGPACAGESCSIYDCEYPAADDGSGDTGDPVSLHTNNIQAKSEICQHSCGRISDSFDILPFRYLHIPLFVVIIK